MDCNTQDRDCAVCLQKCHHPTQLPCGHIFCFLCVKGVAIQSRKCAMCRAQIPPDYLDNPVLLESIISKETSVEEDIYQWYYEGRNGWWKYDERSNNELEEAFSAGTGECMLLLAGALYSVDFQNMIQIRRSDTSRKRRVRRDTPSMPSKGVAGIKSIETINTERSKLNENNSNNEDSNNDTIITQEGIENTTDNENGDVNVTEATNDIDDVVNGIRSINLENSPPVHVTEQEDV